jgi:O-methyltransferase
LLLAEGDGTVATGVGATDLYLDLLKRCLLREIFMRPKDPDRITRIEGRDWPEDAETMIGRARLDNVQACVESVLRDGISGDLLEAGVWRGGASILMRAVLEAHGDLQRRIWLADSFEGLPIPDPKYPLDKEITLHRFPCLAVSAADVRRNFARYGLLDARVQFLAGWFKNTLRRAPIDRLAVLRLDGDLYQSTWETLTALYPKVSSGGYVIIDDYDAVDACRQAVHDYRDREGVLEPIQRIDWSGVFWRRA